MLAGHILSLLESNHIECHLRNFTLGGGIGELPVNECWPQVWVNDDRDASLAKRIITAALAEAEPGPAWQCQCGEQIEGQFDICWSCGARRGVDPVTAPD